MTRVSALRAPLFTTFATVDLTEVATKAALVDILPFAKSTVV